MDWRGEIKIKDLLDEREDPQAIRHAARGIATRLGTTPFKNDELDEIIMECENIASSVDPTLNEFNDTLESLYDWADDNAVWLA